MPSGRRHDRGTPVGRFWRTGDSLGWTGLVCAFLVSIRSLWPVSLSQTTAISRAKTIGRWR